VRTTDRLCIAVVGIAAFMAAAAVDVRAREARTFEWNFARAAAGIPAKRLWASSDFELFKEHLRHRAKSYLSYEEQSNAYHYGYTTLAEAGDLFTGRRGVAQAAYDKWALEHRVASCEVFRFCYGN
jgi:hypothetical protein